MGFPRLAVFLILRSPQTPLGRPWATCTGLEVEKGGCLEGLVWACTAAPQTVRKSQSGARVYLCTSLPFPLLLSRAVVEGGYQGWQVSHRKKGHGLGGFFCVSLWASGFKGPTISRESKSRYRSEFFRVGDRATRFKGAKHARGIGKRVDTFSPSLLAVGALSWRIRGRIVRVLRPSRA